MNFLQWKGTVPTFGPLTALHLPYWFGMSGLLAAV
jgi:hypothetical protein